MARQYAKGFTLIELLIVLAIFVIIASIAVPSFTTMVRNAETRSAAESLLSGVQKARAQAVSRNTRVEFVAATDTSWTVQLPDGTVLLAKAVAEASANTTATLVNSETTATFNSFGRLVDNADTSNRLTSVAVTATGGSKTLTIQIGAGGSARMCDAGLVAGSSPAAC